MKKELTDLFKNSEISEAQNFNSIKISLASPEKIKDFLKSVYGKEILEDSIEKLTKNEF